MKLQYHPKKILSLLALTALFSPILFAQTPSTTTASNPLAGGTGPQPPPPLLPPGPVGGPMAGLTLAEREQLKAAHDKAMKEDPSLEQKMQALRQAMDEVRKAMHDDMLKADPTIAPILDKITPLNRGWGPPSPSTSPATTNAVTNSVGMNPPKPEGHGLPPGFVNLSAAEQQQLKALHDQVKNDPSVIAAHEAMKNAVTPEQRHAAFEGLHDAMRDAMIKADPSVAPVLEKLRPGGAVQPPPPPQ